MCDRIGQSASRRCSILDRSRLAAHRVSSRRSGSNRGAIVYSVIFSPSLSSLSRSLIPIVSFRARAPEFSLSVDVTTRVLLPFEAFPASSPQRLSRISDVAARLIDGQRRDDNFVIGVQGSRRGECRRRYTRAVKALRLLARASLSRSSPPQSRLNLNTSIATRLTFVQFDAV